MKNQAEFKNATSLAEKLLEIFAALAGNAKSFDPTIDGIHDVCVMKNEQRLSAKGNVMLEINLQSVEDGRDVTIYIMKSKTKEWNTWSTIKIGTILNITLEHKKGFPNVSINQTKDILSVLPQKPRHPNTKQTIYIYDIEVFKQDNLFVFRDYFTKEWTVIHNDLQSLREFYLNNRDSLFIGYNSHNYDEQVLRATLQGKNPFHISNVIIENHNNNIVYKMYNTRKTPIFGMDLYQDNRGFSLKEHSAFLGINIKETEVDFNVDRQLTEKECIQNELYCKNDVLATELRFEQLLPMLVAKASIALFFNLNKKAISQTNANLTAELLGAKKHTDRHDESDKYELPDCFSIESEDIKKAFLTDKFESDDNGHAAISLNVERRDVTEVLGVGGIHGAKNSFIHVGSFHARDVGSLYPNTMTLFNYLSRNIPDDKQHIYQMLLDERMKAKYSKSEFTEINGVKIPTKLLINGYKLPLNTKYGAMGAEFNKLYDPRMRLLVCLTGQMAMFDLLEKIEPHATIIQSNTDAHYYIPFSEKDNEAINQIAQDWQKRTGYILDDDVFREIYQKDVNNYIAITQDGKVKIKGALGLTNGLKISKAIVSNAFINYVVSGKDYKEFINECNELRQFQIITKTGYTFDETIIRNKAGEEFPAQKVNRVFAIKKTENAIELFKVKRDMILDDSDTTIINNDSYVTGLPKAPEFYTISNEAIGDDITLDEIDRTYYIKEVEDLLELWFGDNWNERLAHARSMRDSLEYTPIDVKNYID